MNTSAQNDTGQLKPTRRYHLKPGECHYCDKHKPGEMMPPHDASSRCESGKHSHCTCDACF